MWLTTNGWIAFVLVLCVCALLLSGVAYCVRGIKRSNSRRRDDWNIGFFFVTLFTIISVGVTIAMVTFGVKNAYAKRDLESAGFTVISVAIDSDVATVEKDGVRREVALYKSPETGRYTAYLLCEVAREPVSMDRCIVKPK